MLGQLFSEFEIICCLSLSDCRSLTRPLSWDLFTQTDGLAVQSHSLTTPCPFFPPPVPYRSAWPPAADLISHFLNPYCSHFLSSNLLPLAMPESDRALRSSWRQSLCPVWSRPWPSPSCPKVCLSVCLSSPAVVPASHPGVKSPSVNILMPRASQVEHRIAKWAMPLLPS